MSSKLEFTVSKTSIGNGILMYVAFVDYFHGPVALAWVTRSGNDDGDCISTLLHVYTLLELREKGAATALLEEISKDCDIIWSPAGSRGGGRELLLAFGFSYNKAAGTWVKRMKKRA